MRWILKDSTDQSVVIRIVDSADGTPEQAVEHNSSGISLWYRREGGLVVAITPAALAAANSAHADGGIEHLDDGYYRLDLPDAAVATGANGVMVGGVVDGMVVIGTYVALTNVNPYDGVRAGLTALPNAAADAAGGLPISDAGGLDLDAQRADVAAILVDTGTTLDGRIPAALVGGRMDANVGAISTDATAADNLEAILDGTGGVTLVASAFTLTTPITANATQVSGDATAADTLELFVEALDQVTGQIDAGTFAAGAIDAAAIADNAIDAGAIAANAITAAKIADGAIDAATFAADVDAEILSYIVDDATRVDASALNTLSGHDPGETIMGATDLGTGAGLTSLATAAELAKVPKSDSNVTWNATAAAQIQSEVDDALVAQNLDHLIKIAVDTSFATTVHADSVIGQIADNGAGFDRTTDSLEAIRDRGDAAWITATGFSTHSAADVWAVGTRVLTAGTNIQLPSNGLANVTAWTVAITGNITGNLSGSIGSLGATAKADVNAEVDTALTDIHLDHLLAATYDPASKPGAADALLNELVESDAGVSRFTQNALEQGPGGGSIPTAAEIRAEIDNNSTQLAAIKAKTDLIVSAASMASTIFAAGDIDGYSLEESQKLILAAAAGEISGAATTTVSIRAADDSKVRISATVDEDGNRTALTLDETG